ncbi:HAMP domain-containing sensor histidine kinase [Aquimarina addita]
MNIKTIFQGISTFFGKHKESCATLFVAFPGVALDAVVEYNEGGFTPYFWRDIFYLGVMIACLLLYRFLLLRRGDVYTIPVYTIVLGQMLSVLIRIQDPNVHFESYFLKAEIILTLMMFGIGMLVHAKHIVILLVFNLFFMVSSYLAVPAFPVGKFVFYGVIVSSSSLLAYFSQRMLVRLYRKLKEANKIIQVKNEELSEINQSKDRLFRIIGHDLRTPFHQLQLLVDMIDQTDDQQEKAEIKALLKESAGKGNQLLEDLMKWSSSYKQNAEVVLEKKDISQVVERVFEFSDFTTKTKEISLINKLPKNLEILMNPTMMETVLRNLIANSIKFSHRGSYITVQSEKLDGLLKIAIIDKGIGMCKTRLGNLFLQDKNESTSGTENENGSGFGLSIAKKLVEKQNGTFEVTSEYNKGTTISLYFPLGQIA